MTNLAVAPPRRWFFLLRMMLFFALIAIFASFVIFALWLEKDAGSFLTTLGKAEDVSLSDLINLQITGQDGLGRTYIITAHSAKPKTESILKGALMEKGSLTGVEANLDLGNEENWISLRARSGEFDASRHHLRVGPGFDLYSSAGYQMHGLSASFDLKAGIIIIHGQVDGWGPIGKIIAASLESRDMGRQLRFYGGVEVILNPLSK